MKLIFIFLIQSLQDEKAHDSGITDLWGEKGNCICMSVRINMYIKVAISVNCGCLHHLLFLIEVAISLLQERAMPKLKRYSIIWCELLGFACVPN